MKKNSSSKNSADRRSARATIGALALTILIAFAGFITIASATAPTTPMVDTTAVPAGTNGALVRDLNAGGHNITNAATITATNFAGGAAGLTNFPASVLTTNSPLPTTNLVGTITNNVSAASVTSALFTGNASALTNFPSATAMGLGSAATNNAGAFDTNGAAAAVLASGLQKSNNLSDVSNTATARTNLGLGSAAVLPSGAFLGVTNNLSDLGSASAARSNLGLGALATSNTITTSNMTGLGSGVPAVLAATVSGTGSIVGSSNATLATPTLSTPQASTYPTTYLVSVLSEADTTGPKTFTSVDANTFYPFHKGTGGADIYTAAAFRDPRILKVGNTFYLSYTATTGGATNFIGLAYSTDLSNWTTVSTPNWSAYFTGSQNQVWNGCWYFDGTNYWMYFCTAYLGTPVTATPYIVQFTPNGSSSTFGTPIQIAFNYTRSYADIMAVNNVGGTYYGLIQDFGSTTGTNQYVETFSAPTLTGTNYTITSTNNADGFGNAVEGGAEIQLPNGKWKAYFCQYNGGAVYSSTNASLTTNAWSTPVQVYPFPFDNSSYSLQQSADWIDVVPFTDLQTDQSLNALQRGSGVFNNLGTIQLTSSGSASITPYQFLEPNLASGNFQAVWIGKALTTGQAGAWFYVYNTTAASQQLAFSIYGVGPTIGLFGTGSGYCGNYSSDPHSSAPSGSFSVQANVYAGGSLNSAATQTTVNGSTAGTVVCSMPFAGSTYKKVMFTLTGFNGTATYTSPTNFSSTNLAIGPTLSGIVSVTGTNTFVIATTTNTTTAGSIDGY